MIQSVEKFVHWYIGMTPMGAVRMTQSDRWRSGRNRRPAVAKYFQWREELILKSPVSSLPLRPSKIKIVGHFPMPPSWSLKKKVMKAGHLHDEKPDFDNVAKAVCDTLFSEDKTIGSAQIDLYWSPINNPGSMEITVW